MEWKLKALKPIWTGDVNRQGNRFVPTGLMGSLRWWFEVLVRGLGGHACDPTANNGVRCPDNDKEPHEPGHHCVVCELFGCTGWARKFRLMVVDENDQVIQSQIQEGQTFALRFIPLRPIQEEEWCLLDATLRLIADYGAIGGKTVFKPSDERGRENARHHQDFGLVQYVQGCDDWQCDKTLEDIRAYVTNNRWRTNFNDSAFSWASLQNFWCVKGRYLARQDSNQSSFNKVIGRQENKSQAQQLSQNTDANRWLAGRQQESKKVFSFKHPEEGGRTFGFVKPGLVDFREMRSRLKNVWGNDFENSTPFQEGHQILNQLFQREGNQ